MQIFLILAAIGLLIIIGLPVLASLKSNRKRPHYYRSRVSRVGFRQQEFRIYGPTSLVEVEALIDYLTHTFDLSFSEHDPEPDESYWVLESDLGVITLFYDDHEGVRIRTLGKTKRGLFQWLLRELPMRRLGFGI